MSRIKNALTWWPRNLKANPGTYGLCALASVLVVLSYPPFVIFPLIFVAFVPLLAIMDKVTSKRAAFGWGWVMGMMVNMLGYYFIVGLLRDFGYMPYYASIPLYLMLCAAQGVIYAGAATFGWSMHRRGGLPIWVAYPAGWVIAESVLQLIFPVYLGSTQFTNLAFIQSAELGGPTWLTILVMLGNVAVWEGIRSRRDGESIPVAIPVIAALFVANMVYGVVRIKQVDAQIAQADTIRIGLVEADVGINDKGDPNEYVRSLLRHQQMSASLEADGAELIVWPETMFEAPRFYQSFEQTDDVEEARREGRLMMFVDHGATWFPYSTSPLPDTPDDDYASAPDRFVPQRGFTTPALVGLVTMRRLSEEERDATAPYGNGQQRNWALHNSAMLLDAEGRVLGIADKMKLMPFSEITPFGSFFWNTFGINIESFLPVAGAFTPGEEPGVLELPHGDSTVRLGVMVCYEDMIPVFGRMMSAEQPNILINVTNDAWFGQSSASMHHFALSTLRTVEQRTSLLRATNTGISAVVDPVGRILERTETVDAETVIFDTPIMNSRRGLYVSTGNWPFWLSSLLFLVGLVRGRRMRKAAAGGAVEVEAVVESSPAV